MWLRRSAILVPLTCHTSKDVQFQWTDIEQQAFDKMKAIVCCKVLLSYPDFNKAFHIHTDASDYQVLAVISQNNHPIAFYSHKLQPAQVRYTTTERERLLIIETLSRDPQAEEQSHYQMYNVLVGQSSYKSQFKHYRQPFLWLETKPFSALLSIHENSQKMSHLTKLDAPINVTHTNYNNNPPLFTKSIVYFRNESQVLCLDS
jgi:hypothetical protein